MPCAAPPQRSDAPSPMIPYPNYPSRQSYTPPRSTGTRTASCPHPSGGAGTQTFPGRTATTEEPRPLPIRRSRSLGATRSPRFPHIHPSGFWQSDPPNQSRRVTIQKSDGLDSIFPYTNNLPPRRYVSPRSNCTGTNFGPLTPSGTSMPIFPVWTLTDRPRTHQTPRSNPTPLDPLPGLPHRQLAAHVLGNFIPRVLTQKTISANPPVA